MSRFELSAGIGVLCAVVLTTLRGGWRDAPWVVPVFAIGGFTLASVVSFLTHHEPSVSHRWAAFQKRSVRITRDVVAAIIVVSAVYWAAPVARSATFAGWLVMLLLGLLLPLVVCVIASRAAILYGMATASMLTISGLSPTGFRIEDVLSFARHNLTAAAIFWCVMLGLSLVVSVPLTIQRRRTAP